MPELPEVELVARSLDKLVKNRTIKAAELLRPRLAPGTEPDVFAAMLRNALLRFVHRRGKHILFDLVPGLTLITHLRMSGRFLLLPPEKENPRFTHAVFHFDDGKRLVFQDQRHFGFMDVVPTAELNESKALRRLAPEPFSEEFSTDYLYRTLRASRRRLKEVLLDQTKVCGLGNIYAAEAMFLAGIHPGKKASKVSRARSEVLHEKIVATLLEAVSAGSTLNVDPENIEGNYYGGRYEFKWRVYDREKMPCPACRTAIIRLKQGGRSSYFCPKCQKR